MVKGCKGVFYHRDRALEDSVGKVVMFTIHALLFLIVFGVFLRMGGAFLNNAVLDANGGKMPIYWEDKTISFMSDETHKVIHDLGEASMPLFIDRIVIHGQDLDLLPSFLREAVSYTAFRDPEADTYVYCGSVGDIMIYLSPILWFFSGIVMIPLTVYVVRKKHTLRKSSEKTR